MATLVFSRSASPLRRTKSVPLFHTGFLECEESSYEQTVRFIRPRSNSAHFMETTKDVPCLYSNSDDNNSTESPTSVRDFAILDDDSFASIGSLPSIKDIFQAKQKQSESIAAMNENEEQEIMKTCLIDLGNMDDSIHSSNSNQSDDWKLTDSKYDIEAVIHLSDPISQSASENLNSMLEELPESTKTDDFPSSAMSPDALRSSPPQKQKEEEMKMKMKMKTTVERKIRKINPKWMIVDNLAFEGLQRRLHYFRDARQMRKKRDNHDSPRHLKKRGLYSYLRGIRTDLKWVEDAASRYENKRSIKDWDNFQDESNLSKPYCTHFIMFLCTMTLLISIRMNGWKLEKFNANPMIGPSDQTLLNIGALQADLIVNDQEWFRLLTVMFVNAGVIHYILNMMVMWHVGRAIEQEHGFLIAIALFVIPAICGGMLSTIFLPRYVIVGISSGICGWIGGYLADILIHMRLLFDREVNENDTANIVRNVWMLVIVFLEIILYFIIGLVKHVDNFAHFGGLLSGLMLGLALFIDIPSEFVGTKNGDTVVTKRRFIRYLGIIGTITFFLANVIVLSMSDGITTPCEKCVYLSCMPSRWQEC